jgi:hypothetical protein
MSYYGSFVFQCYVLRMRVMTSTVGGNVTNRPPALRHIHFNKRYNINQKDEGTLDDRGKDGGTKFILRIKEQETRLTLHEHDDGESIRLMKCIQMFWWFVLNRVSDWHRGSSHLTVSSASYVIFIFLSLTASRRILLNFFKTKIQFFFSIFGIWIIIVQREQKVTARPDDYNTESYK